MLNQLLRFLKSRSQDNERERENDELDVDVGEQDALVSFVDWCCLQILSNSDKKYARTVD